MIEEKNPTMARTLLDNCYEENSAQIPLFESQAVGKF